MLTNPLYDFVLENLALDLGQLKILSASKTNVKTEKGVKPDAAVEDQGEAVAVNAVD